MLCFSLVTNMKGVLAPMSVESRVGKQKIRLTRINQDRSMKM